MSHRIARYTSTLKHCLGEILLHEINDPDLMLVTISEVSVSPDLKRARVLVSSPQRDIDRVLHGLERAKGFIKARLPHKMSLRFVPELIFLPDMGFELEQKLSHMDSES